MADIDMSAAGRPTIYKIHHNRSVKDIIATIDWVETHNNDNIRPSVVLVRLYIHPSYDCQGSTDMPIPQSMKISTAQPLGRGTSPPPAEPGR
ncbi:MAG: hypothetical protein HDT37_07300 [Clostridiales bacterium]|nr:hypothetical protein [Clostridiales bacterium]